MGTSRRSEPLAPGGMSEQSFRTVCTSSGTPGASRPSLGSRERPQGLQFWTWARGQPCGKPGTGPALSEQRMLTVARTSFLQWAVGCRTGQNCLGKACEGACPTAWFCALPRALPCGRCPRTELPACPSHQQRASGIRKSLRGLTFHTQTAPDQDLLNRCLCTMTQ